MADRDPSERQRGESPRAYSQRLQRERAMAAAEAEDQKVRDHLAKQRSCSHYECEPIEWHWNGKPRVMYCRECELQNYLEDKQDDQAV